MLHKFGLITYSPELLRLLEQPTHLLEPGSRIECEIRAASILSVYYLSRECGVRMLAIDFLLWNLFKREQNGSLEAQYGGQPVPMHRCVGYFY